MSKKIIEIKNLSYSYPDKTTALSKINLEIFEGESVGIIGPNGAGKTTLLLHLNGILQGEGVVKICGMEINEKNLSKIRSKVGLIFQDPDSQLFMPTVFDDVAFGPINMNVSKEKLPELVQKALNEVDMLKAKDKLAHHLSFGEKKRVSFATVLSMEPEILAMDEPTSNLDPKHRRKLLNLIKKSKHTKIIATHDLELVLETCLKVIILDKGIIVSRGNTKVLLSDKFLLEAHELEMPYSLQ